MLSFSWRMASHFHGKARRCGEEEEERRKAAFVVSPSWAPGGLCSVFQPTVAFKPHDNEDDQCHFTDEETEVQEG